MKKTRKPIDPSLTFAERPFWWDELSKECDASAQQPLPSRTDVLVIGSGYTGMTAALRLRQNGAGVVVLDSEPIGSGASSRNGGLVLSGLSLDLLSLRKKYGKSIAGRMFSASLASVDCVERLVTEGGIECSFSRSGHLQAAYRPSHFEHLRQEQGLLAETFGQETVLLGPEELGTEIGSEFYCGGLLDPRGAGIQPAGFIQGLARMAAEAGVKLHPGVEALEVGRQSGHCLVRTRQKTILADEVVVATNAYTGPQFPWFARRIVPVESLIIASEELPPEVSRALIPNKRVVSDTKRFLFYFQLSPDGKRIIFGGRPRFPGKGLAHNARIMYQDMLQVFPQLGDYGPSHAWNGKVGFSRDFLPHVGRCNGLAYAMGYGGHGVALASYLGERLAAWIQGREDPPVFQEIEFRSFPLYRGRPWFVPLVHRYFSLLDRVS